MDGSDCTKCKKSRKRDKMGILEMLMRIRQNNEQLSSSQI